MIFATQLNALLITPAKIRQRQNIDHATVQLSRQ